MRRSCTMRETPAREAGNNCPVTYSGYMSCRDRYGYRLTTSPEAAAAYNRGIGDLLRLRTGAVESVATSVVLDPTFALGHAALALLGHEMCAPVDVAARLRDAAAARRPGHRARAQPRARGRRPPARRLAPAGRATSATTRATPCCCRPRCRRSPSPG